MSILNVVYGKKNRKYTRRKKIEPYGPGDKSYARKRLKGAEASLASVKKFLSNTHKMVFYTLPLRLKL